MKQLMLTIAALKAAAKTDDQITELSETACNNVLNVVSYQNAAGVSAVGTAALRNMSTDLQAIEK